MDKIKIRRALVLPVFLLFLALSLMFAGCGKQNPVDSTNASFASSQNVLQTDAGPVFALQVDRAKSNTDAYGSALLKGGSSTEYFVTTKDGATLQVEGDDQKSKAFFEKNTLNNDMTVVFKWAADHTYEGALASRESANMQVAFNKPVKIELSFKNAYLAHVNENNLVFCVWNEEKGVWEKVEAKIDFKHYKLQAVLNGFSKFALLESANGNLNFIFKKQIHQYYAKKFIRAAKGGKIRIGDKTDGVSELNFPKNALPADMTILFDWMATGKFDGTLNNVEFGPHGTFFNKPVRVRVSYALADLSGIIEENLRAYYYNQDTGIWEYIGGTVNTRKKIIEFYVNHFSRYAIAYGR